VALMEPTSISAGSASMVAHASSTAVVTILGTVMSKSFPNLD